MRMKRRFLLLFLSTVLMILSVAARQNTHGIITGVIKDAKTKSPITEAVITLSSDVFKGQKFAVTDSTGKYKISKLPPGNYTIIFEMEGYRKFVRDSVTLKEGMSIGINYDMVKEGKAS